LPRPPANPEGGVACKHEDQSMLAEFWEFDQKMIHEKYSTLVKSFNAG
jgi:hypothetical protein